MGKKTPLISSNPNMNRGNTPSNPVANKNDNKNKGNNNGNNGNKDKDKGPNKPNKPTKTGTHTTVAGTPAQEKAPKMKGPVPDNTDYLGNIPDGYTKKTRGNWRERTGMSQGPTDKPFFKHTQRGTK